LSNSAQFISYIAKMAKLIYVEGLHQWDMNRR